MTIEKEINSAITTSSGIERYIVYSRYFARITKYIKRSVAVMKNFHEDFSKYSAKFEKPLYFIGLGCIGMSIAIEYGKIKNQNLKKKGIFWVDTLTWHALASFIFPGFIISNSIHGCVLLLRKIVKNPKILNRMIIAFSFVWIPLMVNPIDNFTKFIMDHSLRLTYEKI
jgi:hypothetical protein